MGYQIYTAEFKMAMINEFINGNYNVQAFAKDNNIRYSTFRSWLYRFNKNNQQPVIRTVDNDLMKPIDVTSEAKAIAKRESSRRESTIKMEYKGMKLSFPASCLKEVLEAIRNG